MSFLYEGENLGGKRAQLIKAQQQSKAGTRKLVLPPCSVLTSSSRLMACAWSHLPFLDLVPAFAQNPIMFPLRSQLSICVARYDVTDPFVSAFKQ